MLELNKIYNIDCVEGLQQLDNEYIDMVVTSPPYDCLRKYNGFHFDFNKTAIELYRVIKNGGVVVWVVGDQTSNGSESGTSFKQALYFKEIGFNIHDTMIYRKQNYMPLTHNRYEQEFEYMFVFSKGKPKTFNPIMVPCKYAGTETWGDRTVHKTNSSGLVQCGKTVVNETKQHGNIFTYLTNKSRETNRHPAPFPEALSKDMIISWSNENDIVLDPFIGSGTTAVSCIKQNRYYIGFEISAEYCDIANKRLENAKIDLEEHDVCKDKTQTQKKLF